MYLAQMPQRILKLYAGKFKLYFPIMLQFKLFKNARSKCLVPIIDILFINKK